jgi:hypothetical protein
MNVRMVDAALEAMREVDVVGARRGRVRAARARRSVSARLLRDRRDARRAGPEQGRSSPSRRSCRSSTATARRIRSSRSCPISALDGTNVDRLESLFLCSTCRKGEPLYPPDYLTDQPERVLRGGDRARAGAAAHARRAAVLDRGRRRSVRGAGDEGGLLALYCTILVERASQKPDRRRQGRRDDQAIGTEARMAAQRRIDLVLDSVKRLLRIGATANLLNLLQKQHPADLAQVFGELPEKERHAAFTCSSSATAGWHGGG